MPEFLRAYCERQADGSLVAPGPIRFVASTEGVKRDGRTLRMDRWMLDSFRQNPVFLWAHDYWGRNLPIGRVEPAVENGQLMADVTFDQEDDFARQVESKYRRGYLNAVSVGWNDVQKGKEIWHELLDVSAVPVPGDADALMERQYRALQAWMDDPEHGRWTMEDALPHHAAGGEVEWSGVARAMIQVIAGFVPDGERRSAYNHLERHYRELERVAPEFRLLSEVEGLGESELRGLFLEGEATDFGLPIVDFGQRVGAVLNARNRDKLGQAVALIQAVLESAEKEPKEEPPAEEGGDGAEERMLRRILDGLGGHLVV